jgi:hypothetical protein
MLIATLVMSFAISQTPAAHRAPNIRLAMAMGLIEAYTQKHYDPPKQQEVKADTAKNIVPESLPAPVMSQRQAEQTGPDVIPSGRLAQASQDEILKRLERLEEENRRLKQQAQPNSSVTQSGGPTTQRLPAQMVPGWKFSLYEWNSEGNTSRSPTHVFQVRNQRITARLGQRPIK